MMRSLLLAVALAMAPAPTASLVTLPNANGNSRIVGVTSVAGAKFVWVLNGATVATRTAVGTRDTLSFRNGECPDTSVVQLAIYANRKGATTTRVLPCTAVASVPPHGTPTPAPVPVPPPVVVPPPVIVPPIVPPVGTIAPAELPRVSLDTMVASARNAVATRTISPVTSTALQAALDTARYGDRIALAAGATYTGPFVLRRKTGAGWITLTTATTIDTGRMRPSRAPQLARLVSQWPMEPVIATEAQAAGYRLTGLEITANAGAVQGGALITLGNGGAPQTTLESQPSRLVLDRIYLHGTTTLNFQRCIALNSGATAIVDSWVSECHGKGFDSQAIWGSNGAGPYLLQNNTLEGAGENVMFGGSDPAVLNQVPADITIRGNHFYKPPAWRGVWSVKNSFELKIASRVLIEGNVFENNWADAQSGFAVLFKSTNQDGRAPWSQTSDVTFRYNIVRASDHGLSMAAAPEAQPAIPMARIVVSHNSFEALGAGARVIQTSGVQGVTIAQNAGIGGGVPVILYGDLHAGFVLTNNLFGSGASTLTSADGRGIGTEALNAHAPGWIATGNVFVGARCSSYPAASQCPATLADVGFLNMATNWRLSPASPYQAAGPDYVTLARLTAGAVVAP